jgi:biotin carboxyl carrier protein
MRTYELELNGQAFDVRVKEWSPKRAVLEVNGSVYDVAVKNIVDNRPMKSAPKRAGAVPLPNTPIVETQQEHAGVVAPIPGAIIEIVVKEGEQVAAGQKLLVMEAMKMENVITANSSGTISKIMVAVGDSVRQGQLLVKVE